MINIVVALQCEAKPLIKHYGLKGQNTAAGFRLYDNKNIQLIVSGVGKIAAAAATAFLYARRGEIQNEVWLNVGVAGHNDLAIGTVVLGQKIIDAQSGYCWYPPLVFDTPCQTLDITTVEKPALHYVGQSSYDMEAAGFYATASRFATTELVQCLKIISDNREEPADRVSETQVQHIIGQQIEIIDQCLVQLNTLADAIKNTQAEPAYFDEFIECWHFTQYQKNELHKQLLRWQVLIPDQSPIANDVADLRKAKNILQALQSVLDRQKINF